MVIEDFIVAWLALDIIGTCVMFLIAINSPLEEDLWDL